MLSDQKNAYAFYFKLSTILEDPLFQLAYEEKSGRNLYVFGSHTMHQMTTAVIRGKATVRLEKKMSE